MLYKRDYINFLRGLAIFLMLWGHSVQHASNGFFDFFEDSAFKLIYSFHMPLFMMISGYLFHNTCRKMVLLDLLKYKTRTLFLPIMMCSIVNYYLTTGLISLIRGGVTALFNGAWLENITSLWFLWSVLVFSLVLGIGVKISDKIWLRVLLILIGWFVTALFPGASGNIYLYPYFLFGFQMAKYEITFDKPSKKTLLIGLISFFSFFALLCSYQKKHYIYTSGILGNAYTLSEYFLIDVYRWAIGFAGCICFIVASQIIYKYLHNKPLAKNICSGCRSLGIYSLEVYALSVSLLSAYLPVISRVVLINHMKFNPAVHSSIYDWLITPLIAVFYSVVLVWLTKFLYKIHLGLYIFGSGRNEKGKVK